MSTIKTKRMLLLLAACLVVLLASFTTCYAKTGKVSKVESRSGGTHYYTVTSDGETYHGYCCQASNKAPYKGLTGTMDARGNGSHYARTLVYGLQHGWSAIQMRTALTKISNGKASKEADVPSNYRVYKFFDKSGYQNLIVYNVVPDGYLKLKKSCSESSYNYSFEGASYSVTNSAGGYVGSLGVYSNGNSTTLTLTPGTYYVSEASAPSNNMYQKNSGSTAVTVYSGATTTLTTGVAVEKPNTATLRLVKTIENEQSYAEGSADNFKFEITNNSGYKKTFYTKASAEDPSVGEFEVKGLYPGEYTIQEIITDEQNDAGYQCKTENPKKVTLSYGKTTTVSWENTYNVDPKLRIIKITDDGSSTAGFAFDVEGICYDSKTEKITEENILNKINPTTTLGKVYEPAVSKSLTNSNWKLASDPNVDDDFSYSIDFTANKESFAGIEASEGSLYFVQDETNKIKVYDGTLATAYQDISITGGSDKTNTTLIAWMKANAKQQLKDLTDTYSATGWTATSGDKSLSELVSDMQNAAKAGTEKSYPLTLENTYVSSNDYCDDINVSFNATVKIASVSDTDSTEAKSSKTDKYESTYNNVVLAASATPFKKTGLVTDAAGTISIEEIKTGKYTVTERLTDAQKLVYRQPDPQTKEITSDSVSAILSFTFENVAKRTPVKLQKSLYAGTNGSLAGHVFELKSVGSDARGIDVDETYTTNETGLLDFGYLYPGDYVLQEISFDPDLEYNMYKVSGYDCPTIEFSITGDEGKTVWLGTGDGNEGTVFINKPYTQLWITKTEEDTTTFIPGAEFEIRDENDELQCAFRLVRNKDGSCGVVLNEAKEGVTAPEADEYVDVDPGEDVEVITDESITEEENLETEDSTAETAELDYKSTPFGLIKGLDANKTYKLIETKSPAGYSPIEAEKTFDFTDGQKLVVENRLAEISTTLLDDESNTHVSITKDKVNLTDHVYYKNLVPGTEYTMIGKLYVKPKVFDEKLDRNYQATPLVQNGFEITSAKTFTPEEKDGILDIPFTIDASELQDVTLVAEEVLYIKTTEIAGHFDIDDLEQTVYFPRIKTTALADDTNKHITAADEEISITDTVEYKNLDEEYSYKVKGVLVNAETGNAILDKNGDKVTAESEEFTPENKTGEIKLNFKFNGSDYAGVKTVVFEKLYIITENKDGELTEVEITSHEDVTDEGQTIYLPKIGTKIGTPENNTITDTVNYENLIPGQKYTMYGQLIDKETGKPIEGTEAITKFIPGEANGSVNVVLNAKGLKGKTVVAFEECYIELDNGTNKLVAAHKDLEDKDQTYFFAKDPKTGDTSGIAMAIICFVIATGALVFILFKRKKK